MAAGEEVRCRQAALAEHRAVGAAADRLAHDLEALGADGLLGALDDLRILSMCRRMFRYCGLTLTSSRARGSVATTSVAVRVSSATC